MPAKPLALRYRRHLWQTPGYDGSVGARIVAQMAATIAGGLLANPDGRYFANPTVTEKAVAIARAIVAEVERTQPEEQA